MTRTEWGPERPRHSCRSKLVDDDPVAAETMVIRRQIEAQDRAFVAQLRAAILAGTESARGVLGHGRRQRLRR